MLVNFLIELIGPVVAEVQWMLDFIWPAAGAEGVDTNLVLGFAIPLLALIPLVLIAMPLERKRPIENHSSQEARATIRTEWLLVAFMAMIKIAYYPAPDEYPKTGLRPREKPQLWEGIIWPFRGWLGYRRRKRP